MTPSSNTNQFECKRHIIQRSLKFSIGDGICYAFMIGLGELFFIPYANHFGFRNSEIVILTTAPLLMGSLLQLTTNQLVNWFDSKKKLVCTGAFLQALLLLPLPFIQYIDTYKFPVFLVISTLYFSSGMIIVPAWSSWMGDLLSENARGRFFGYRNRMTGITTLAALLISGFVMNNFSKNIEYGITGFSILFIAAAFFRFGSFWCLKNKFEPPGAHELYGNENPSEEFKFFKSSHFRRLAAFITSMNFSVFISVPFFIPYMLNDVKMNYLHFTLAQATVIFSKFMSSFIWGKISDRFGNRCIIKICSIMLSIIPFFWLFSDQYLYILIIQFYSGIAWAGFELSVFNLVLDNTPACHRVKGVAILNMMNGLAIFSGSMIGVVVVNQWSIFSLPIYNVFFVSACCRCVVTLIFTGKLREFREVESLHVTKLFFRPFANLNMRSVLFQSPPEEKK